MPIFHRLDFLTLEVQVPVFISPRNRVAQLYPQAMGTGSKNVKITCGITEA
jgi:hypothetical protein